MNILKTKPIKMSLDAIKNSMSREEMKGIIAGSGYVDFMQGSNYMTNQNVWNISMSGTGNPTNLAAQANNYAFYGIGVPNNTATTATTTSTWTTNVNGNLVTSNPADIAQFMEMMKDPNSISNHSIADIRSFINGEMAIMTQIKQLTQTAQLTGAVREIGVNDVDAFKALALINHTELSEVLITANYKKIVSGSDALFGNYDVYTNPYTNDTLQLFTGSGGSIGSIGSSSNLSFLQQGVPKTDCFFQCLGWISQMNGDTVHDANYYAGIYAFTHPNTSVIPNFNLSSFNKPTTNGVPLDQASAFAGTFFKATDYSGATNQFLSNWINPSTNPSGNNQLIGVYRTPSGTLHAVAVTSISGSTINYYDPQNGSQGSFDMSVKQAFYGITANK